MPYHARITCFKTFILDPIDNVVFLPRPIGMRRPAVPQFARPLGHAGKNDGLIAQSRDAGIKYPDHFPIRMAGTNVFGTEQQMSGKAFNHARWASLTALRVPLQSD